MNTSSNPPGENVPDEKARRANRIFESRVRPTLSQDADPRDYVAIDLASKDFEIDREKLAAADRLVERHPEAKGRLWFRRVGTPVAHHIGGRLPRERPGNQEASAAGQRA